MNTTQKIITHSDEQKAIFAWFAGLILTEFRYLIVIARAGVGKTFTAICAMLEHAKENKILYCVFMKRNEIEAKGKINSAKVDICTAHALGYRIVAKAWGRIKGDAFAEWNRVQTICPELCHKKDSKGVVIKNPRAYLVPTIVKLIDAAKNVFLNVPSLEDITKLAIEKGCEANDKDSKEFPVSRIAEIAIACMELAKQRSFLISFGDMIWLPVALDLVRPEYPLVVADEYQDLNPVQIALLERIMLPNGRLCGIGDDRQAIYVWRGAMANSLALLTEKYKAATLKLTKTFRCAHEIVKVASSMVPDYVAHEDNAQGEVLTKDDAFMLSSAEIGHAILSRVNAPLMRYALALIRQGKKAKIEGKDIEKDLLHVIETIGCDDFNTFEHCLDVWAQTMISKASGRNATQRIELINDQSETLKVLAEVSNSTEEMVTRIKTLFQNSSSEYAKPAIILSTVHKAKGLEWSTVYLLSETFNRTRKDTTPEQAQEEQNVYYVAVTRAQNRLVLVQPSNQSAPQAKPSATKAI